MKKIALIAGALVLTAGTAMAMQGTPGKIKGSKHDISTLTTQAAGAAQEEICIYCHTPHNAKLAVPLWNRINPTASLFTLYNSPTLTSNARATRNFREDSISLFCMSCHDGQTQLGATGVKNNNSITPYTGAAYQGAIDGAGVIDAAKPEMLGYNLSNTHPVGFTFPTNAAEDTGLWNRTQILTNLAAGSGQTTAQQFLYGAGNDQFECASCHRVHDPGQSGNFLRIENDQSNLCLACHNK